jgi:hypothetical protein
MAKRVELHDNNGPILERRRKLYHQRRQELLQLKHSAESLGIDVNNGYRFLAKLGSCSDCEWSELPIDETRITADTNNA